MRKVTFIIASLVLLFAVTSAYNDGNRGVQPGQIAPLSELPEAIANEAVLNANEQILLNFWSASDAESRVRTKHYQSITDKNIRLINVNIDDNESLSRAIAKDDGIAHSHRIHGSLAEKIRREFRLPDNCGGALLIASDGTVSAANPEF